MEKELIPPAVLRQIFDDICKECRLNPTAQHPCLYGGDCAMPGVYNRVLLKYIKNSSYKIDLCHITE